MKAVFSHLCVIVPDLEPEVVSPLVLDPLPDLRVLADITLARSGEENGRARVLVEDIDSQPGKGQKKKNP